jgi:hypothetical protein
MNVRQVDMRETRQRWKANTYRVYLWMPLGPVTPRDPLIGVPYESSAFELSEVSDVSEALQWAAEHTDGGTFTLYAVDETREDLTLIHVSGLNPNIGRVTAEQRDEVARLFTEHGLPGELKMVPVTTVDERVFVVPEADLARVSDLDRLKERVSKTLAAPVRFEIEA